LAEGDLRVNKQRQNVLSNPLRMINILTVGFLEYTKDKKELLKEKFGKDNGI
jgi:hypothetical protein